MHIWDVCALHYLEVEKVLRTHLGCAFLFFFQFVRRARMFADYYYCKVPGIIQGSQLLAVNGRGLAGAGCRRRLVVD